MIEVHRKKKLRVVKKMTYKFFFSKQTPPLKRLKLHVIAVWKANAGIKAENHI